MTTLRRGVERKLFLTTIFLLVAYISYLVSSTSFLLRADATVFAIEITQGLDLGSLIGKYKAGQLYQSGSIILLSILGFEYSHLQELAAVIVTIVCITVGLYNYSIIRNHFGRVHLFTGLTSVLILPIFSSYMVRLIGNDHKAYTFILIYSLLYILIFTNYRIGWNTSILTFLFTAALLWSNYTIASYNLLILFTILLLGSYNRKTLLMALATLPIIAGTIFYSPFTNFRFHYYIVTFKTTFNNLFMSSSGEIRNRYQSGESIWSYFGAWPDASLFGYSIDYWYLTHVGLFLAILISVFAVAHSCWNLWERGRFRNTRLAVIIISFVNLVTISLVILSGDVASAQRLSILPGMVNIMYFNLYLFKWGDLLKFSLLFIIVVSVIASGVGVVMPGAENRYAPENQISQVKHIVTYEGSNSQIAVSSDFSTSIIAKQLFISDICEISFRGGSKVYSSSTAPGGVYWTSDSYNCS